MRSLFCGCALLAVAMTIPAIATVKDGVDAWNAGDYAKAVAEWRGLAAAGEPDAQYNLGQAYKFGRGVPADPAAALDWYRRAAALGHEQAQAMLGLQLFQNGQREEAMGWLKKAAEQGEPRAQYVVGTAYFNGDPLPKDWARAYALMSRAKAGGIGAATVSLAQMDQLIPEQQRQAGLALAREMERSAQQRAETGTTGKTPTLLVQRAHQPAAPATVPPSAPAAAVAPPAPPAPAKIASPARPAPKAAAPTGLLAAAGGGWKIQLGAFSSADAAKTAWTILSGKVPAVGGLNPSYTMAGKFTRLRAGPLASRAGANQACSAVQAAGTACFPIAP